jgi:hypothetical protein
MAESERRLSVVEELEAMGWASVARAGRLRQFVSQKVSSVQLLTRPDGRHLSNRS